MKRRDVLKGIIAAGSATVIPTLPALADDDFVYVMFRPSSYQLVNQYRIGKISGSDMILLNVEKDQPNWVSLYGENTFCPWYLHRKQDVCYSASIEKMKRSKYEWFKDRAKDANYLTRGSFATRKWIQEHLWQMPVDSLV